MGPGPSPGRGWVGRLPGGCLLAADGRPAGHPEGKALYRQRAAIIEPVFAQLFNLPGWHLHYRGTKVDLELHLWAATHNLLKAIRAQARRPPHPADTPALAS